MKRWLFSLIVLASTVACSTIEIEPSVHFVDDSDVMRFRIGEESATRSKSEVPQHRENSITMDYCPLEDTRVTPVTIPDSLYVSMFRGTALSYTWSSFNNVFKRDPVTGYYVEKDNMLWPEETGTYHVYFCNRPTSTTPGSVGKIVLQDTMDYVCAYLTAQHKQLNSVTLVHPLARLGSVNINCHSRYSARLVNGSIRVASSGRYTFSNQSWASLGTYKNYTLSSTNDIWCIPQTATVSLSIEVTDTWGERDPETISLSRSITLVGGKVNNINVNINMTDLYVEFEYEDYINPSSGGVAYPWIYAEVQYYDYDGEEGGEELESYETSFVELTPKYNFTLDDGSMYEKGAIIMGPSGGQVDDYEVGLYLTAYGKTIYTTASVRRLAAIIIDFGDD